MSIIEVKGLSKRYGDVQAVDNVSFEVRENEIFALVGPNGAGKTTTIEIIEGIKKPDEGFVTIDGKGPDSEAIKEIIGVQLQNSAFYGKIRVSECIDMFRGFYKKPLPTTEVLKKAGLENKADAYYDNLSGGLKQRVAIGVALVGNPKLLFLDEITTGLDPQARRAMWDLVRELRDEEKTIFMTTHYMEEAERLADRVGIMDYGKIIALDTPKSLIKEFGGENRILYEGPIIDVGEKTDLVGNKVVIKTNNPEEAVQHLMTEAAKQGVKIRNLTIEKTNLEDVFLRLTGREMRE